MGDHEGATAPGRIKVAILGGGTAGLTSAWELSATPERRAKFEVTVYQMGWRLGGKGASGRNPDRDQRTEEHGIHVWFGFYENAFRMMRACYDELVRIPPSPALGITRCLGDAFLPHEYFVLNEMLAGGAWAQWAMFMKTNPLVPGDGVPLPAAECPLYRRLADLMASLRDNEAEYRRHEAGHPRPEVAPGDELEAEIARRARERATRLESGALRPGEPLRAADYLAEALDLLGSPDDDLRQAAPALESAASAPRGFLLGWRMRAFAFALRAARYVARVLAENASATSFFHRAYLALDTFAAIATGLDRDVFAGRKALDDLDDLDLRDWLLRHGADERFIKENPSVRFVYNSAFAFENGDAGRPRLAAGAALKGILRVFMTYKGALAYRMTAGMGDIVFGPLYQVLRARGVRFEFFHRVEELDLGGGDDVAPVVERIVVSQQVKLRNGGHDYQPLDEVKGLRCWPDRPRYGQIENGAALAHAVAGGLNLEDPKARWQDEERRLLVRGRDFDRVVLAIPVEALKPICAGVARHRTVGARWRAMLDGAATTATQAFQVWFRGTRKDLGWDRPAPVFGTYQDPIDTYVDMSETLGRDLVDPAHARSLAYFCGVLDGRDGEAWEDAQKRARDNARAHLAERCHYIWPHLRHRGQLDWGLFTGGSFDSVYTRANVLPAERYTLTLPGRTHLRLGAADSGCSNLYLAGDWTRNPLNLGCVEGTVMSGLACARALTGEPIEIIGEDESFIWQGVGLAGTSARPATAPAPGASDATTQPPAARRPTVASPAPGWEKEIVERITGAVGDGDLEQTRMLCGELVRSVSASPTPFPEREARDVLSTLRRKRHFALLTEVAEALVQYGQTAVTVRRQQAQALIDTGQPSTALVLLRELRATDDPRERAEVAGLIGRVHKQLFVSTYLRSGRVLESALHEGIAAYGDVYDEGPERHLWHGINVVALLMRAMQEGVAVPGRRNARAIAAATLDAIKRTKPEEQDTWDLATAAEACVALDDNQGAFDWIRKYVQSPGADVFELTSTFRQLTELWQLTPDKEPGESMLPTLESYLVAAEGGRRDLASRELHGTSALIDRHLERVRGLDVMVTARWYRTGLERCRLVARIDDLVGNSVGTGFLVRAGDFSADTPDPEEMLLLTAAHVLSDPAEDGALRPMQATVLLENLDPSGSPARELRVERILWQSGVQELDAVLARLSPAPHAFAPYPIAAALPDANRRQRVYAIGYPVGHPVSFSLHDNLLVETREPLLYYRTPTAAGSSGSPIFNDRWELVALHRAGDAGGRGLARARLGANEGVWIEAIRTAARRGS